MPQSQASVFLQKEATNARYQITSCVSLPHRTASQAFLSTCSPRESQELLHSRLRFPRAFLVATGEPRQLSTGSIRVLPAPTLLSLARRVACETFTAPRILQAFAAIES